MTAAKMPSPGVAQEAQAPGLSLQRCEACAAWQFPPRRLCLQCGGTALAWAAAPVEGVVDETTVLRRGAGLAAGEVRHLATVRHASGAMIVARLNDAAAPGTAVNLEMRESGAIWASPRES